MKNKDLTSAMELNSKGYGKLIYEGFSVFYGINENGEFINKDADAFHNSYMYMVKSDPEFEAFTSNDKTEKFQLGSNENKIRVIKARYNAYNGNKPFPDNSPQMKRMVDDINKVTGGNGGRDYTLNEIKNIGLKNEAAA